ncbi:unnamed protein product, partial [Ectocarpus fasciculatus]
QGRVSGKEAEVDKRAQLDITQRERERRDIEAIGRRLEVDGEEDNLGVCLRHNVWCRGRRGLRHLWCGLRDIDPLRQQHGSAADPSLRGSVDDIRRQHNGRFRRQADVREHHNRRLRGRHERLRRGKAQRVRRPRRGPGRHPGLRRRGPRRHLRIRPDHVHHAVRSGAGDERIRRPRGRGPGQ